jgi:hypothetical protein
MSQRLSYANVTATVALLIALGGTGAYAAGQLPTRSVGAKQLRPGAVTAGKLRKNAVIGSKIKAGVVGASKLAPDAVKAEAISPNAVTGEKIGAGAVSHDKIAADAITGDQVVESTLGQVPAAAAAASATFAASANPVAFARVDAAGSVDLGLSKGIGQAEVSRTGTGAYCLAPQGFIPRGAQATAEDVGNGTVTVYVKVNGAAACPFPKVGVRAYNSGAAADEPFYIAFYD